MSRIRINCPHCQQPMEVRVEDSGRKLRCTRCKQTFQNEQAQSTEVPSREVSIDSDVDVVKVACQSCEANFGVKPSMSGKKIACPACKTRQIFYLNVAPHVGAVDATAAQSASAEENIATEPVVKKTREAGNRATVVHSGQQETVNKVPLTETARQLLPPRYTVDEEVEQQVAIESVAVATDRIQLGIDPAKTRINRHGELVEVKSLTLDQKRRRRSLRVAIVFLVSIAILVGLFLWLLNSFESTT